MLLSPGLGLTCIVIGALFAIVGSNNDRKQRNEEKERARAALEERRHQELLAATRAAGAMPSTAPPTDEHVITYAAPVTTDSFRAASSVTASNNDKAMSKVAGLVFVVVIAGVIVYAASTLKQNVYTPLPTPAAPSTLSSTSAPVFDPLFFHGSDNSSIGPFTLPAGHYLMHLITRGSFIATVVSTTDNFNCGMQLSPFIVLGGDATSGLDVTFRTTGCTATFKLETVNAPYSLAITALLQ